VRLQSVAIVLALLALSASTSWGRSQQKPPEENKTAQQPPANDQRGTEQSPAFIKIIPSPKTAEETESDRKEREQKDDNDLSLVRLTGALAFIGFLQLLVFGWQGIQLKRTVSATKEATELGNKEFLATHRPKIRVKNVWLLNEFWYDHPLNMRVVCVNYGTTDAQLIDYGVDFLTVRRGVSLPPDHQFAFRRTISTILNSGISGPFPDLVQPIDQGTEIAVRNGEADFYCIGYLHYLDRANNPRTTAFCRRLILGQQFRGGGHFIKVENPDYEYED
jgi:hypothetical protein